MPPSRTNNCKAPLASVRADPSIICAATTRCTACQDARDARRPPIPSRAHAIHRARRVAPTWLCAPRAHDRECAPSWRAGDAHNAPLATWHDCVASKTACTRARVRAREARLCARPSRGAPRLATDTYVRGSTRAGASHTRDASAARGAHGAWSPCRNEASLA